MRRTHHCSAPPALLAVLLALALCGCADSRSLCEARLTPINIDNAVVAPPARRAPPP